MVLDWGLNPELSELEVTNSIRGGGVTAVRV